MDDSRQGRWAREPDSETEHGSREPSSPARRDRIREEAALAEDFLFDHRRNHSRRGSVTRPHLIQQEETLSGVEFSQRDGPGSEPEKAAQNPSDHHHATSFRLMSPPKPPAPSQTPAPAPAQGPGPGPIQHPGSPSDAASQPPKPSKVPHYKPLSDQEWAFVARALGGLRDRESQIPVRPRSGCWPARGMPPGLFKDVVEQRIKYTWANNLIGWIRLILVFLQLAIGATLTAIGSIRIKERISITVLGATNTVIAGLLALLHNSGLPERYRNDQAEFEALEDHIKELLDSRVAPADLDAYQIVAQCFELFQHAKRTVISNKPATYTSTPGRVWTSKGSHKSGMPANILPPWQHPEKEEPEKRVGPADDRAQPQ